MAVTSRRWMPRGGPRGARRRRRVAQPVVRRRRRRLALGFDAARDGRAPADAHSVHGRHGRHLRARQGRRQRRVRQDLLEAAQRRARRAMDLLVQQKPQIFDKSDEFGSGTGQYRVLDKEAYLNGLVANLVGGGLLRRSATPTTRNYERILVKNENGFSENFDVLASSGHMRRGGQLLRDLHAGELPGRPGRPAAGGQRLRLPVPGADRQDELQAAPLRTGLLHARLDGARRGPGLLRARRVPGPRPVPGAARDQPGAGAVRDLARRQRQGHRPAGSDLDRRTASTARGRRAAARTTPRTSTPCSSTRPARTRSAPTPGACCSVEVER